MELANSPSDVISRHMSEIPVNLRAIIDELGIEFREDPTLPATIAGKLMREWSAPSGYRITVNARDNPRRQRFTMAHELAHYVLHRDLLGEGHIDSALYRSTTLSDEYERQADRFAAQILLPAETLREAFNNTSKALSVLARMFDVSDAALRIRLSELGLAA